MPYLDANLLRLTPSPDPPTGVCGGVHISEQVRSEKRVHRGRPRVAFVCKLVMPASKRSRKATRFDASVFTAAPEKILVRTVRGGWNLLSCF